RPERLSPDRNPFPTPYAVRTSTMMFNITEYTRVLMAEFLRNGGVIETRSFGSPGEFSQLAQKTLINATGYGAKALFRDDTITPVRGQLARLMPQPDLHYGVLYDRVLMVPRRDGLVIQALGRDDGSGWGDETTAPDRNEALAAVQTIADLA